jgi:hypothetical protein
VVVGAIVVGGIVVVAGTVVAVVAGLAVVVGATVVGEVGGVSCDASSPQAANIPASRKTGSTRTIDLFMPPS